MVIKSQAPRTHLAPERSGTRGAGGARGVLGGPVGSVASVASGESGGWVGWGGRLPLQFVWVISGGVCFGSICVLLF